MGLERPGRAAAARLLKSAGGALLLALPGLALAQADERFMKTIGFPCCAPDRLVASLQGFHEFINFESSF